MSRSTRWGQLVGAVGAVGLALAAGMVATPAAAAVEADTVQVEATLVPSVGAARSVTTADLDGDGTVDLVVARRDGGVSRQLGLGGGRFAPPEFLGRAGAGRLTDVVVADFDADGFLDVAVGRTDFAEVPAVVVLQGVAGGDTKARGTAYPTSASPDEIRLADVNRDGDVDLLVSAPDADVVDVLLGGPGITFTSTAPLPVGDQPAGLSVTDLNGDGRLDVAVANGGSDTVSIRYGDGQGGFPRGAEVPTRPAPQDVEVADLNRDGLPDLVVGSNADPATDPGSLSVLQGTGPGAFREVRVYETAPYIQDVTLADFDADGHLDAVVGSGNNGAFGFQPQAPGFLTVIPGVPGSTAGAVVAKCGKAATDVAVADLDGDGDLDVISTRGLLNLAALFDPLG